MCGGALLKGSLRPQPRYKGHTVMSPVLRYVGVPMAGRIESSSPQGLS